MSSDDPVADAQTQACSLANFLGGEKGIKNTVGVRYAWAVVPKFNLEVPVAVRRHDPNLSGAPCFANGVVSVIQNIQENLLQLVTISDNERQFVVISFGK